MGQGNEGADWKERKVVNGVRVDFVQLRQTCEEFEQEERSLREMSARLDWIASSLRAECKSEDMELLAYKLQKQREVLEDSRSGVKKMRKALELVHGACLECERRLVDDAQEDTGLRIVPGRDIWPGIINLVPYWDFINMIF